MIKAIRNRDGYGHHVQLNFDQQGSTMKTVPGGFLTILLNLILIIVALSKVLIVFNKDGTLVSTTK
jgi:hypothetical protein